MDVLALLYQDDNIQRFPSPKPFALSPQNDKHWTTGVTTMQTLALGFQNDNIIIPKLPLLNETAMQTFT